MTAQLSQPTLGLLRRVLEAMEPNSAVALSERKKFWKDQLFDFGFAPRIIEVAVSYEFRWGDIISDLFIAKFGPQNQHFSDALPPYFCEQTLMRLLALSLHEGKDPILLNQLAASLKRDEVEVAWPESVKQRSSGQTPEEQISGKTDWLTATEQEILRQVVRHFLKTHEPTSRILLVKQFGNPDIVDKLTPVILRNPTGEKMFPTALAFHCCGDINFLSLAQEAVEFVVRLLQNLFKSSGEKLAFSFREIEEEAQRFLRETEGPLLEFVNKAKRSAFLSNEPDFLQLGLYLAQDFRRVHSGMGGVYPNITHVVINEQIGSQTPATAWNEHVEQYRLYLESRGEKSTASEEAIREPGTPNQSVRSLRGNAMQPVKVLNEAIKAVPAVKYALGIGGVIAVIAIAKSFGIDYRVAVFGVVIMLVLMTMLVIFARLAAKRESDFHLQAVTFTWFALILTMATAVMLFSSVFWGQPLDLRYKGEPPSSSTAASIPARKNEEVPPIAQGGAPVGAKYQYTYKKNDFDCTGEYVKVSATDWQQRLSSESPAECRVDFVVFTFTERESNDQHYFLLYDASRNLFARFTDTEKGQQSPNEWRLVTDKTWNQTYAVTRVH